MRLSHLWIWIAAIGIAGPLSSSIAHVPVATDSCMVTTLENSLELSELEGIRKAFVKFNKLIPSTWTTVDIALRDLSKHPLFAKFIQSNKIELRSLDTQAKIGLMKNYKKYFFDSFENPIYLATEQDKALKEILSVHGITRNDLSGRKLLETTSSENVKRILSNHSVSLTRADEAEFNHLANQIELAFVHNTANLQDLPIEALLSSRQLENFGFRGGLNTFRFNKEVMKTDDNVYFVTSYKRKGDSTFRGLGEYGGNNLVLNPAYAKANGWISHFVMHPDQLLEYGVKLDPKKYGPVLKKYERYLYGEKVSPADFPDELKNALFEVRQLLHLSDFTVSDFERLLRRGIVLGLSKVKSENPIKYSFIKSLLETGTGPTSYSSYERASTTQKIRALGKKLNWSPNAIEERIKKVDMSSEARVDRVVKDLLLYSLDMGDLFELKVPVAVPKEQLRFISF
jgi:hypothetical protein